MIQKIFLIFQNLEVLPTFDKELKKYGPILYSWLGPYPFLVVSEPVIVQDILTSQYCINKGVIYDALDDGTGKGLFSLKGKFFIICILKLK